MKKIFIVAIFFAFSGLASAQVDKTDDIQTNQDKIQQEPPRDAQKQIDRNSNIEATKQKSDAALKAEKNAKDKGHTKDYSKVHPEDIKPVNIDNESIVQPVKKAGTNKPNINHGHKQRR